MQILKRCLLVGISALAAERPAAEGGTRIRNNEVADRDELMELHSFTHVVRNGVKTRYGFFCSIEMRVQCL